MAGSTARYGGQHKARRAQLLRALARDEGQPCPRCHAPMFSQPAIAIASGMAAWMGRTEADHYPVPAVAGGRAVVLSHAKCNRLAGARLGRAAQVASYRARGLQPPGPRRTRQPRAWIIGPQ